MYAPCVYLSSISCVNRLPPVSSLDSLRARTDRSLLRACRRRPGGFVYQCWVCVPMRGTPARPRQLGPGPRGVSLNRLG